MSTQRRVPEGFFKIADKTYTHFTHKRKEQTSSRDPMCTPYLCVVPLDTTGTGKTGTSAMCSCFTSHRGATANTIDTCPARLWETVTAIKDYVNH